MNKRSRSNDSRETKTPKVTRWDLYLHLTY